MVLLLLAIAPVVIIAFYIYFRDKYEKEPFALLVLSLVSGAIITVPVLAVDVTLNAIIPVPAFLAVAYKAFISAGMVEEFFKFIAVYLLIWKSRSFNERVDGIVYAVFVSLGFALVENIMYVTKFGYGVAILRALTAVPMHAITGIFMGFYFGIARFIPAKRRYFLFMAFFIPFLIHGLYDYLILKGTLSYQLLWIPYFIFIWYYGLKRIRFLLNMDEFENHRL